MPILTIIEPDSYDMDYYYSKYRDRHRLGMNEDTSKSLCVLPPDINPNKYESLKKKQHYFKVPIQPTIGTCLCDQYHTKFTSHYYKITIPTTFGLSNMQTSPIISVNHFNKISDTLPAFPILKQPQIQSTNPTIFFSSFNTNPAPTAFIPYSQHVHTCAFCKIRSLSCVLSKENKHSPDYTTAIIFKTRLIHRSCTHRIIDIKLTYLSQTKPLSQEQKEIIYKAKFISLSKTEKINLFKEFLSKLPKKGNKNQQQQKRDTSQDLDWFKTFPITKEIEPNSKLNTSLAQQLFDFLKPNLISFAPEKIIPSKNPNIKSTFKYSFDYLLKMMAEQKPKFLVDLVHKSNPSISSHTPIPIGILTDTLKLILGKFLTIFFTKLNYKKILQSHYTILLYTLQNQTQVVINLARLHLFLNSTYQTIHAKKFAEDLNIQPLRLTLHYYISYDLLNKAPFQIQNDDKLNVNISFNINTEKFQNTFQIPSLKPHKAILENWFNKFFEIYKRHSPNIIKNKVLNFLKYQTATRYAEEHKKLLPQSFNIESITSLQERTLLVRKLALFYVHTCKNTEEHKCEILPKDTEHNFQNLSTYYFDQSYITFPAPIIDKSDQTVKPIQPTWTHPTLDFSIFHKENEHSASFKTQTPIKFLRELA